MATFLMDGTIIQPPNVPVNYFDVLTKDSPLPEGLNFTVPTSTSAAAPAGFGKPDLRARSSRARGSDRLTTAFVPAGNPPAVPHDGHLRFAKRSPDRTAGCSRRPGRASHSPRRGPPRRWLVRPSTPCRPSTGSSPASMTSPSGSCVADVAGTEPEASPVVSRGASTETHPDLGIATARSLHLVDVGKMGVASSSSIGNATETRGRFPTGPHPRGDRDGLRKMGA